jgi:predicted nuclease with TOPRIM domain
VTPEETQKIEEAIRQLEAWRLDYAALRKEVERLKVVNAGLLQNFKSQQDETVALRKRFDEANTILNLAEFEDLTGAHKVGWSNWQALRELLNWKA